MAKKTLIADLLHYPISLSAIEKALVATPVFNRLHSVKQNSTAYLTFPSLNQSRFSHSLGAMHLAGELFYYGILNAPDRTRCDYLENINSVLHKIGMTFHSDMFVPSDHDRFPMPPAKCAYRPMCAESPSLDRYVPHFLSEDHRFPYLVAFQAVRIAALVHDLGHPPLSHATENAMKAISFAVTIKSATPGSKLSAEEKHCKALLKIHSTSGLELELHESLTLHLFRELGIPLRRFIAGFKDPAACYGSWAVLELVPAILMEGKAIGEEKSIFDAQAQDTLGTLHGLIAGDLDADRLDYIQRDLILSGIREGGFRPQRLIELYELCHVSAESVNHFTFMPSVRALRSLEEFFLARYDLYRNVVFHHHVVKTDGLLTEVVKGVALKYLNASGGDGARQEISDAQSIVTGHISDIRWLWNIFETNRASSPRLRDIVYLQWDDHWLMSVLRHEYIRLRDQNFEGVRPKDNVETADLVLFRQLEDLIGSNKNYISLVKRFEDFLDIEHSFLCTLLADANFSHAILGDARGELFAGDSGNPLTPLRDVAKSFNGPEKSRERAFGAIMAASRFLSALPRPSKVPVNLLEESARAIREGDTSIGIKLLDVLFVQKEVKPGLRPTFLLKTEVGISNFSDYSNLARELLERQNKLPTFFVFVLPNEPGKFDRFALRTGVGRVIAENCLRLSQIALKPD